MALKLGTSLGRQITVITGLNYAAKHDRHKNYNARPWFRADSVIRQKTAPKLSSHTSTANEYDNYGRTLCARLSGGEL